MTQHVYARLAGFNLTVIPRAPYRIRQAAEPLGLLSIEHTSGRGKPSVVELLPCHGSYETKTTSNAQSLLDVADIEPGPSTDEWRIETTVFACSWPLGYSLCSTSPNDTGPFDLVGSRGELIYIQQPSSVPDVADMCATDQSIINIERGDAWDAVDLQYNHAGQRWRQRHVVVSLQGRRLAVTVQSPAEFSIEANTAANKLAESLTPYEFE